MPFEYGSQQVEIPNPFRFEGAAYTVRATVLVLLGLFALLSVRTLVADGERAVAAAVMIGGLCLLGFGAFAAYRGLYKMFRFYVGRGQPADLSATVAAEQTVMPGARTGGATGYRGIYQPVDLANMLLGRKNPTFVEPEGWLPRLLHSLIANLIFLPYALRNDAGSRFAAAAHSVVILALLGLAWFSGVTGLVPMAGTPVMSWLVAVITVLLLVVWLREAVRPSGGNRRAMLRFTPFALVIWAAVAILTPFALVALNGVQPLPELPFSPAPWFVLMLLLAGAAAAYSLLLAIRRAPRVPPATNVSEYREHWQESVHPMDIFRAIEITLAKHRFQEIPNRVYVNDVPQLVAQGSQNKGEFEGRTVQEIQPRPIADRRGDLMLQVGIIAGQVLLLGAGITVFAVLMQLTDITPSGLFQALLAAVILWTAGRLVAHTSTLYVSEIEFESDLIVFQATGTFAESKLATGMSIYDSTRSENTIVRSSLTPWLIVSRLHTSTLTVSGSANLEQPRLILGMADNPTLSRDLVADARAFLKDRQIMASVNSEADLQAAGNIYQMNERTRANAPQGAAQPQIPQERRNDNLLSSDEETPPQPSPG
jgi:hypothetical protein